MQNNSIRIGTRESELAVWQANLVKNLLRENSISSELVYIKSDGDIDLTTPLYAMGVQGVFTRSLDIALLNNKIDIAVHSMKDVPVQLPQGIVQAAVLERGSYADILVHSGQITNGSLVLKSENPPTTNRQLPALLIATSSIRRKAQWLHRYPNTTVENLRGNVNTRLKKVAESNWYGAIFAAAGLERLGFLEGNKITSPYFVGVGEALHWMLPAPAQGAIMVVAREDDVNVLNACTHLNNADTAMCVKVERDFLSALMGGCSTPISAFAEIVQDKIIFKGNIVSPDGKDKVEIEKVFDLNEVDSAGKVAADALLENSGQALVDGIIKMK